MAAYKAMQLDMEPVVNIYEFDERILTNNSHGLKIKCFKEYDEEWANFIFENRNNVNSNVPVHDYDIVYGPIANDRVGLQIRNYMEHNIDLQTFLERLKYMKGITFQYFFGTERAIKFLKKRNMDLETALDTIYTSDTFQKLKDSKTGLYFQSPLYVYDFLEKEIETGRMS